ncbi:hypothetical protein [Hyphomonas sp.]|uniref:hypothetical protein n=1 Tax=Hyphomonas sp. TaxID=87 RepID=UPI00391DDC8E
MHPARSLRILSLALGLSVLVNGAVSADADRSASIRQVTNSETLAERSSAAFEQIASVAAGRSSVSQIDPLAAEMETADSSDLGADRAPGATACILTPEQQSIVTSLESQGKLPAGDCELVAWFSEPGDKSEAEDRRALAESVAAAAPDLLGREAEAGQLAREAEELARAEAMATAIAVTIFAPPPGE